MSSVSVNIDVNLDEFETSDIFDEFKDRFKNMYPEEQVKYLERLKTKCIPKVFSNLRYLSVLDEIKLQIFIDNFDKKSVEELEKYF